MIDMLLVPVPDLIALTATAQITIPLPPYTDASLFNASRQTPRRDTPRR